jgi:class 3 adenylate cyclase
VDRKLAAILSADVAGFSRLAALDEESTVRALNLCRSQIAELVREHDRVRKRCSGRPVLG